MSAKRAAANNKKQGDRSFITLLGILLVVGAAIIVYIVRGQAKPATVTLDPNAPLPEPKGVVMGSETAPVEIVEFGDFECPGCGRFATITEDDVRKRIVATGKARFRFMDFPLLSIHRSTLTAHNAAACGNAQNKFWEMHDRIFFGQTEWSAFANGRDVNTAKIMKRYAKELGLDTKAFDACLDAQQFQTQILANLKEGERVGVGSTPTFFIGNRKVADLPTGDLLLALVDSATADLKKAAPDTTKKKSAGK